MFLAKEILVVTVVCKEIKHPLHHIDYMYSLKCDTQGTESIGLSGKGVKEIFTDTLVAPMLDHMWFIVNVR